MLLTNHGKNDVTARQVLVAMAEQARVPKGAPEDEKPRAFSSLATLRFLTGLDRRVIQRAQDRLAAGKLITEDGRRGEITVWVLNTDLVRPDSDREAIEREVDEAKAKERERWHRRRRSGTQDAGASDTENPGGTEHSGTQNPDSSTLNPDSSTLDAGLQHAEPPRTGTTDVEPVNEPVPPEAADADAPHDEPVILDAEIVEDEDGVTGLFDAPAPAVKTTAKPKRRSGRPKRKLNAPLVTRHGFPEPARHVEPGEAIRLIVGLWVDTYRARGVDPAGNTRGQAAAEITALIDVGNNPNLVAAAAKRAAEAGYATVIREVERMVNSGQPATGRRSTDPLAHLAPGDQNQCRFELMKTRPNWDKLATYGVTPAVAAQLGYAHASEEESA